MSCTSNRSDIEMLHPMNSETVAHLNAHPFSAWPHSGDDPCDLINSEHNLTSHQLHTVANITEACSTFEDRMGKMYQYC